MNEASKTRSVRNSDFYSRYMNDSVLDIGCGPDLVVPHATPFDQEDGDANEILNYFKPESFSCVHSSHCLEHMRNPQKSIADWWTLLKPGGYLITVVPDEELYEQGYWPSLFNTDHKSMFRLDGISKHPEVSFNMKDLVSSLPGATIISVKRHSGHYCHWKPLIPFRAVKPVRSIFFRIRHWFLGMGLIDSIFDQVLIRAARLLNVPTDQTLGKALAQIEVVAQKRL
ncbi:class I SAM-dependent methyltransferase [Edaphobacter bradus]|uniref:class I SAM-dependent methyltransferase n=1 Tax=Edaphobacter bradus TaxID=2259016 RepID=UPI0021E0FAD2|nr:class I SAM-dependent methyltransferase [Edaphobacter bradus]